MLIGQWQDDWVVSLMTVALSVTMRMCHDMWKERKIMIQTGARDLFQYKNVDLYVLDLEWYVCTINQEPYAISRFLGYLLIFAVDSVGPGGRNNATITSKRRRDVVLT